MADIMRVMPELEGEELMYVRGLVEPMTDDDAILFANAYRSQRRDSTNVLLLTLLGFVVLAGLQRFYVGQIGMGIAYLLTAGFCFIGDDRRPHQPQEPCSEVQPGEGCQHSSHNDPLIRIGPECLK